MRWIDRSAKRCGLGLSLILILFAGSLARAAEAPPAQGPAPQGEASTLAATPPMGWNSWDGYGTTVKEADVKANATVAGGTSETAWLAICRGGHGMVRDQSHTRGQFQELAVTVWTAYGRYTPAVNRFPSAAKDAGFKPLADYVHSLGLKFGIHILRGIPKQAVEKNLAIDGIVFPCHGRGRLFRHLSLESRQLWSRRAQAGRPSLLRFDRSDSMPGGKSISSRWTASQSSLQRR